MPKKLLILGCTGKMGTAIERVFGEGGGYEIVSLCSRHFDALYEESVRKVLDDFGPDIVINSVAFLGIDPCEKDMASAFALNVIYPKLLARLSNERKFTLVHFSTDAVFGDIEGDGYYTEDSCPAPVNMYGITKHAGDCVISAIAERHYIFRIGVLFGPSGKDNQFVEKMLSRVRQGHKTLNISADIFSSPTYNMDAAREIKAIMEGGLPWGLYHTANSGRGSLYDLMTEIAGTLGLKVKIERASYKDFPSAGRKNINTPMTSIKRTPLRSWREAVREYCMEVNKGDG